MVSRLNKNPPPVEQGLCAGSLAENHDVFCGFVFWNPAIGLSAFCPWTCNSKPQELSRQHLGLVFVGIRRWFQVPVTIQIRMAFNGFYAGSAAEGFFDHNHSDPKKEWGNFGGITLQPN